MNNQILTLYHESDHILPNPTYGFGKADNDYGSGFYTTADKDKAADWAVASGGVGAYVNIYQIDTTGLNVVNLDESGTLAWIAEIVYNRGARGEAAMILAKRLSDLYKVDLSDADIVIGYRADDSYSDIVDAFLQNQLNIDEVNRLFHKGELGLQYFIKSEKAFERLEYKGNEIINTKDYTNENERYARSEVSQFLRQRTSQIYVNGYQPQGITAREAVNHVYEYNKEYSYYSIKDNIRQIDAFKELEDDYEEER